MKKIIQVFNKDDILPDGSIVLMDSKDPRYRYEFAEAYTFEDIDYPVVFVVFDVIKNDEKVIYDDI